MEATLAAAPPLTDGQRRRLDGVAGVTAPRLPAHVSLPADFDPASAKYQVQAQALGKHLHQTRGRAACIWARASPPGGSTGADQPDASREGPRAVATLVW